MKTHQHRSRLTVIENHLNLRFVEDNTIGVFHASAYALHGPVEYDSLK